jgi:Tol biopolymer transport system component
VGYDIVNEVRWSPTDDDAIAFSVFTDELDNELRLLRPASGQVEILARSSGEDFESPAWSPDGTTIAYAHCGFSDKRSWVGIESIRADGQGQRLIARWDSTSTAPRPLSCPVFLAWSPDAATLAFESQYWLWTMPAGGGGTAAHVPNARTRGYAGIAWRS